MTTVNVMGHKYTAEQITKLNTQYKTVKEEYDSLLMLHSQKSPNIGYKNWFYKTDKGYKYANHGVLVRLNLLQKCINNIFNLYPPNKNEKLNNEELDNINIFLHSFVINTSAIFDSIAWHLYEEEKTKTTNLINIDIGIDKNKFKKQILEKDSKYQKLIDNLVKYKDKLKRQKKIRDSLVHRIPLALRPGYLSKENYILYKQEMKKIIKTNDKETNNQTKNLIKGFNNYRNKKKMLDNKKDLLTVITPVVCFWNEEKEDNLILHFYLESTWKLIIEFIQKTLFIDNPSG